MKLYKLTDAQGRTRAGHDNEVQWVEGTTHSAVGAGTELCSADVIHAYRDPLVALLMNPAHAALTQLRLWEAEGDIVAEHADKCGVKTLRIVRELPIPHVTGEHRVRFAIACALRVYDEPSFVEWAHGWLSEEDRTAWAAARAAAETARATRAAKAAWAARAARATAEAAWAARAARATAEAAWAAAEAARAAKAAWAARAATRVGGRTTSASLILTARWACSDADYSALAEAAKLHD